GFGAVGHAVAAGGCLADVTGAHAAAAIAGNGTGGASAAIAARAATVDVGFRAVGHAVAAGRYLADVQSAYAATAITRDTTIGSVRTRATRGAAAIDVGFFAVLDRVIAGWKRCGTTHRGDREGRSYG